MSRAVGEISDMRGDNPSLCLACTNSCCTEHCTFEGGVGLKCWLVCCAAANAVGVTSTPTPAGQPVKYVAAGVLTLDTATWDASTGDTGGLVAGQTYYLSQTTPGRLTKGFPYSGTVRQIGVALDSTTLNVQIGAGNTDGLTVVPKVPVPGAYSVVAYGFACGQDLKARSDASWELALAGTLPGTPMYKNLAGGAGLPGQSPASASAWLSSHVLGLRPQFPPTEPGDLRNLFISGGLFELTEDQWNAVWTASDPNRGGGSGLIPGYPYYLSDVPGTFFLIGIGGPPALAPGSWLTKCFVALSTTTALIQIGDPQQMGSSGPSSFALKWSGTASVLPSDEPKNLADDVNSVTGSTFSRRYPFSAARTMTSFAVRVEANTLTTIAPPGAPVATITVLHGTSGGPAVPIPGATTVAPATGTSVIVPVSEAFNAGDDIEVQVSFTGVNETSTGSIDVEVVVDF